MGNVVTGILNVLEDAGGNLSSFSGKPKLLLDFSKLTPGQLSDAVEDLNYQCISLLDSGGKSLGVR